MSKKKKIGIAILLGLALFCIAYGLGYCDFLVCDPYAADDQIQGFRGTINGQAFDTPYSLHPSGAAIVYDCSALGPEKWNFQNIRAYNVRGESVPPVSFVFPALPVAPAKFRLLP